MNDLAKAGMLSIPVTLLILLVVFGSLMAAGVPLLLALSAVLATHGPGRDPEPASSRSTTAPPR